MKSRKRLVIFDVDGTLVDSQGDILAAMRHAFDCAGCPAPDDKTILSIVGLSLDVAMARLAPHLPTATQVQMVDWYKEAYMHLRAQSGAAQSSPLYPGALEALQALHDMPEIILGVATGKSRRGLDKLLDGHELAHFFATQQVSDHHPSKPHPSMLHAALTETGIPAVDAVMIGDTSFDMDMAQAAGIYGIGVTWGYHEIDALASARQTIDEFQELSACLAAHWETAA